MMFINEESKKSWEEELLCKYKTRIDPKRKPLSELLPLKVPLNIQLDPSSACNFKCDFCFRNYIDSDEVSMNIMPLELFYKALNQIKEMVTQNNEKVKHLALYGLGEPLLNPKFTDMLKAIKECDCVEKVSTITNGSLLTQELSQSIIANGLDQITISIYGLTSKAYKSFAQRDIDFNKLYKNIQYLHHVSKQCHVHIKIVGEYYTENEKEDFLSMFMPYCDSIYIDSAQNVWPDISIDESQYKSEKKKHLFGMETGRDRICPNPFYQIFIHSDGVVSPCCADYKKELMIGDVNKDSLTNIWKSSQLQQLRLLLIDKNYNELHLCNKCEIPNVASTVDITPYKEKLIKIYGSD